MMAPGREKNVIAIEATKFARLLTKCTKNFNRLRDKLKVEMNSSRVVNQL